MKPTSFFIPISNSRTLDGIKPRKQNRNFNRVLKPRKVCAIDTETENGDIFLICDDEGNYLHNEQVNFVNVANWLLQNEGSWIFCWNLSYDADCILKLLPEEVLKTYKWKKELKFEYEKFKIHYIDKKKLTIRKGKHSVHLFDIAQYYDNKSLADAYSKSIGKPLPTDYLKMKELRKEFTKYSYSRNKKKIRTYCIQDCILTKDLAKHWIDTFYKVFGFYTDNWISGGYSAEKVLINCGIHIPLFNETPYDVQELANNCFIGGRFEQILRGFIGYGCQYDLNSAYPHAFSKLPDITNGKWVRRKSIHPDAELGFFFIEADIGLNVKIAPFPFRKKNGTICYPSGKFRTHVTLYELKMVEGVAGIKYKILESRQFIPNKDCKHPFKEFIEKMYEKRLKLKKENNPLQMPVKVILNSIYGKTAQKTNKRMGNLFNPVIASSITGYTRAQLYNFVKANNLEKEVVAFATDSITCTKKIEGLDSEKLGEMKLDKEGSDAIFLSNGFYRFNGKWKNRGIGYDRERKVEIEHLDTKIDKDGNLYILVEATKTTHIKTGVLLKKLKDIGKIEPYEKKINLNSDKKRFWLSDLVSLKDGKKCDSVPIPAKIVGKSITKKPEVDWSYMKDEMYEPESDL